MHYGDLQLISSILVGLTIVLLPLYGYMGRIELQRFSNDNLFVAIAAIICLFLGEKKRNFPKYILAPLVISLVFNQQDPTSSVGLLQYFYIIAGVFLFVNLYERYDRDSIDMVIYGAIFGCLVQSFLVVFKSPNGSLGNTNCSASYLALTSLTLLYFKRYYKLLILFPIFALYKTNSQMGQLSFMAGAFYLLNNKLKLAEKWELYAGSIVFMIAFPFLNLGVDSGRLQGWTQNMHLVTGKHFFFGMGVGWFHDMRIMIEGTTWLMSEHNEFLAAFNVFGILIMLLFVPIFLKFLDKKDSDPILSSVLFVAWCNSYGHFSLHTSTTAIIIIVVSAICLGESNYVESI